MNEIKLLYGSQNFGYNNEKSDKDYLIFTFPSWNDILKNKCTSKEEKNIDNSIYKIKDIRNIYKMIEKSNINDLQFLFSKEKYNADCLNWIFENKEKLIRCNLAECYRTNKGYFFSQIKENTPKSFTRAYAVICILKSMINNQETKFYNKFLKDLRKIYEKNWNNKEFRNKQQIFLENEIKKLEIYFKDKNKDEIILKELENFIITLIKKHLN